MSQVGQTSSKRGVNISIESTVKTENTAGYFTVAEITNFTPKIDWAVLEEGGSRLVEQTGVHQGASNHSLDMEFLLKEARFLYLGLNAGDGTIAPYLVAGADPYTHTLNPDNALPYFTAECITAHSKSDMFLGCWMSSMTISAAQGDYVKVKASALALTYDATQTAPAILTSAKEPYRFAMGTLAIGGVQYENVVHDFSVEITNEIQRGPAWKDGDGSYFTMGSRRTKATVVLDVPENDTALNTLVSGGGNVVIALVLTRGASDTITINFPLSKTMSFPKSWEKSIKVNLNFNIYDETWDFIVVDDEADYSATT